MSDKIQEAYEKACIEGKFLCDSYSPWESVWDSCSGRVIQQRAKQKIHEIDFLAYDGYHVVGYAKTESQAKKIVEKLNSLKTVEAVDSWCKLNL
jgi:hypothetical protein